jgi:hypothetical protein
VALIERFIQPLDRQLAGVKLTLSPIAKPSLLTDTVEKVDF